MNRLKKSPAAKLITLAAVLLLLVVGQSLATDDKQDQTVKGRIELLEAQVEDLQELLEHFTKDGDDVYIEGANLHVVNGLDETGTKNGVGNIIIGYNEERTYTGSENFRTGSHMLVVGREHNYSSYGGIVVGLHNTASGEYASVSGGASNEASGENASVSGGAMNTASGSYASVSGGITNKADGPLASVSGGSGNTASGLYASVSGGRSRSVGGTYDWRAGSLFETE